MKKLLSILLAATMLASFFACQKLTSDKQALLEQLVSGTNFSGVALVTKNGKTVCQKAAGSENNQTGDPITLDTKFCIGSVSKQFTAASILLLQQDGMLSTDDPVTKYFPQFTIGKDLLLRHLLEMRSGIAEFYDVETIDGVFTELPTGDLRDVVTNDNTVAENQRLLEDWLIKQPLVFEPDTDFAYCNSNYFLLARVVEIVSGQRYNDFVRTRIFQPLGMTDSTFIDDTDRSTLPHFAAATIDAQTVYVGVTMGLGDMISNARDIDRWLSSFKTHQLLTEESVRRMSTDYSPGADDYGFGFHTGLSGIYHSGNFTTYEAFVYTNPEKGINIFCVTNDEPHQGISSSVLGQKLAKQLR